MNNVLFVFVSAASQAVATNLEEQSQSGSCTHESIKIQQSLFKSKKVNADDNQPEVLKTGNHSKKPRIPGELSFKLIQTTPHDTNAYTQGLVYYDNHLYESNGGLGLSDIRKVDLKTGQTLKLKKLPIHYFAEGLSRVHKQLLQLTLKKNQALVYDVDSLDLVNQFEFPGDGWGLVKIDNMLLISNGSPVLRRINSRSFQLLDEKQVTLNGVKLEGINEMENVNGLLYANIWPTDCIAIIDPDKYHVIAWINLSGLYPENKRPNPSAVLNGIAYNPEQRLLYVTGKNWPYLYHLKLNKYPERF